MKKFTRSAVSVMASVTLVTGISAVVPTVAHADESNVSVDFGKGQKAGKSDPEKTKGSTPSTTSSPKTNVASTDTGDGESNEYTYQWLDKDTGMIMFGTGGYNGEVEMVGAAKLPVAKSLHMTVESMSSLAMSSVKTMGDKIVKAKDLKKNADKVEGKVKKALNDLTKNQADKVIAGQPVKNLSQAEMNAISPHVDTAMTVYKTIQKLKGKSDEDIQATVLAAADPREWSSAFTITAASVSLIDGKLPWERTEKIKVTAGSIKQEDVDKRLEELGMKEKKEEEPSSEETTEKSKPTKSKSSSSDDDEEDSDDEGKKDKSKSKSTKTSTPSTSVEVEGTKTKKKSLQDD